MKMAYEMRAGSGSLFKNENKTSERHPDYKGKVMMPDGQVRWLSGWKKQTAAGDTWLSLAIGDPVQQSGGGGQPMTQHSAAKANAFVSNADDDIPF
jgi:uncharacterized protein (DUF736 family)